MAGAPVVAASADAWGRRPALPTLTGLRFVAALLVFGLHSQAVPGLVAAGRSGVSFFFVLSGFVLTWSARPGEDAGRFWVRRAARIVPAYLPMWILGIFVSASFFHDSVRSLAVAPGFVLMQAWFPPTAVHFAADGVGWSLSCEVFFSLLFPCLFRLLIRRTDRALLLAGGACAAISMALPLAVRAVNPDYYWTYIFPPARLPEFVLGMVLAIAVARGRRLPVGGPTALGIAVVAYVVACDAPAWANSAAITLVPWCVLIVAAAQADITRSVVRTPLRILTILGTWSYAFYLVHQLVLRELLVINPGIDHATWVIAGLAFSLGGAAAVHHWIEEPARRGLRGGGVGYSGVRIAPSVPVSHQTSGSRAR